VTFKQVTVTWFIAFISVYIGMLNLRPTCHLDGSFGQYFPPSLPRVSRGHSNAGAHWRGLCCCRPCICFGHGDKGARRVGKGFSPSSFNTEGNATAMGQREVLTQGSNLTVHLLSKYVSCFAVILVAFLLTSSTGDFDLSPTSPVLV